MNKNEIGGNKPIIWIALLLIVVSVLILCNASGELSLLMLNKFNSESKMIFGSSGTLAGTILFVLGFTRKT